MKDNNFIKGTLILIICNLIGKVLGAIYRIPLASIIGGEGMGQYQLIFPLYCLVLTISTSGIPVAISKIVSQFNANGEYQNSKKLLKISLFLLTGISIICAGLIVIFAKFIATLQGNFDIYFCYYAIAPAILFVGILSALRGYFQGNLKMHPTAISGLIEQVIKLIAGLFLAKRFIDLGTQYAVFGAILGISISEFVACLYLMISYFVFNKQNKQKTAGELLKNRQLSKKLMDVAIPITFSGLIAPLTAMIDSFLVINLLIMIGFSNSEATVLLGLQSGIVEPLVNIPVVIAVSISTALLPTLSVANQKQDKSEVNSLIFRAFEISLSIAATCFVCFIIFGRQILTFLYGGSLTNAELLVAVKLLFFGGINIIFLSLVQVSSGILQGLNHQKYPVFSLFIGCIIKIGLDVALIIVPQINIFGSVISAGACYAIVFLLNWRKVKQMSGVKLFRAVGNIIVQQFFVCGFAYFLNKLFSPMFGSTISLFAAGIITGIIFLITFYILFLNKKTYNRLHQV